MKWTIRIPSLACAATISCLTVASAAAEIAATPWPSAPAPLGALVEQAWRSNLALAGEVIEIDRATARLAEARSYFLPRIDLAARYTIADGGRTIDVPVGDLLNGAYATLNHYLAGQGQPARFSPVARSLVLSRLVTPVMYSLLPPPGPVS